MSELKFFMHALRIDSQWLHAGAILASGHNTPKSLPLKCAGYEYVKLATKLDFENFPACMYNRQGKCNVTILYHQLRYDIHENTPLRHGLNLVCEI